MDRTNRRRGDFLGGFVDSPFNGQDEQQEGQDWGSNDLARPTWNQQPDRPHQQNSTRADQTNNWANGGSGNQNGGTWAQPNDLPPEAPPVVPNKYEGWGQYAVEGLDPNKVQSGHDSPKYQIARIQSHFDPTKGVTQEMIDALNALTYQGQSMGKFRFDPNATSNDWLYVDDGHSKFNNVKGADIAINSGPEARWGSWGGNYGVPAEQIARDGGEMQAQGPGLISSLLDQYGAPDPAMVPTSAELPTTTDATTGGGEQYEEIGNNLVRFPDGTVVPKDHPIFLQRTGGSGGGNTGGGGNAGGGGEGPISLGEANNDLWAMLMDRAKQGLEVDGNDPVIKNQVDSYAAQEERARRNYLSDEAERSSPYSTGSQAGIRRMTAEGVGQRVGSLESQLVGREMETRRNEIQHALDSMGNLLTEQQRQALQKELAQMNNAMEKMRLDTQNSQFYSGLSQSDRHFMEQLAQSGRFADMDDRFRYAQLGQNQDQFLDDLGFRISDRRNYWDWTQRGN